MVAQDAQTVGDGSLVRLINRSLFRSREVPPMRPDSVLRASGLAKMCMRMEVIRALQNITGRDEIDTDLRLIFDHGHGIHHALQNLILPMCGDALWGQWRCRLCGTLHRADDVFRPGETPYDLPWQEVITTKPEKCATCSSVSEEDEGDGVFIFEELLFVDKELGLTGHNDGILKLDGMEGLGILEGKSIGGNIWKVRNAPLFDHVVQAHCYMMFTGLKWALILYWHKGTNGIDGLKEHIVPFDPEVADNIRHAIRHLRESLFAVLHNREHAPEEYADDDNAVALLDQLHNDGLVPNRICAKDTCKRALSCPVVKVCFRAASEEPE